MLTFGVCRLLCQNGLSENFNMTSGIAILYYHYVFLNRMAFLNRVRKLKANENCACFLSIRDTQCRVTIHISLSK